jgi:hypothetical protein
MIDEVGDAHFKGHLDRLIQRHAIPDIRPRKGMKDKHLMDFSVTGEALNTIKVQLRALGL